MLPSYKFCDYERGVVFWGRGLGERKLLLPPAGRICSFQDLSFE